MGFSLPKAGATDAKRARHARADVAARHAATALVLYKLEGGDETEHVAADVPRGGLFRYGSAPSGALGRVECRIHSGELLRRYVTYTYVFGQVPAGPCGLVSGKRVQESPAMSTWTSGTSARLDIVRQQPPAHKRSARSLEPHITRRFQGYLQVKGAAQEAWAVVDRIAMDIAVQHLRRSAAPHRGGRTQDLVHVHAGPVAAVLRADFSWMVTCAREAPVCPAQKETGGTPGSPTPRAGSARGVQMTLTSGMQLEAVSAHQRPRHCAGIGRAAVAKANAAVKAVAQALCAARHGNVSFYAASWRTRRTQCTAALDIPDWAVPAGQTAVPARTLRAYACKAGASSAPSTQHKVVLPPPPLACAETPPTQHAWTAWAYGDCLPDGRQVEDFEHAHTSPLSAAVAYLQAGEDLYCEGGGPWVY